MQSWAAATGLLLKGCRHERGACSAPSAGTPFWNLLSMSPIMNEEGEMVKIVGVQVGTPYLCFVMTAGGWACCELVWMGGQVRGGQAPCSAPCLKLGRGL